MMKLALILVLMVGVISVFGNDDTASTFEDDDEGSAFPGRLARQAPGPVDTIGLKANNGLFVCRNKRGAFTEAKRTRANSRCKFEAIGNFDLTLSLRTDNGLFLSRTFSIVFNKNYIQAKSTTVDRYSKFEITHFPHLGKGNVIALKADNGLYWKCVFRNGVNGIEATGTDPNDPKSQFTVVHFG